MTFHIDLINVSEIAPFVPSVIIIQILKIIRQGHNRRLDLVAALTGALIHTYVSILTYVIAT